MPVSCKNLARDAIHLVDGFDHVHRNTNGACLIRDRAGDGLTNPPGGVGRELVAAAIFEFVHGFHQADVTFLNQIEELQATVGVFFCNGNHQAQVGLDHFAFGTTCACFASGHLAIDFLQVLDRNADLFLQRDQALLAFDDSMLVACQTFCVGLFRADFLGNPVQIAFIARKHLDKVRARHAGFVHGEFHDVTLVAAYFFHQIAHAFA